MTMTRPSSLLGASALCLVFAACNHPTVDDDTKGGHDPSTSDDTGTHEDEDEAPVAAISAPSEAEAGETIVFDGSDSYDPQGYALTDFDWSCTDGSSAQGETVELSFADAGDVSCTLTVTSESGLSDAATQNLVIDPGPSAGASDWTIMVFMNGDNNLEDAALNDMNELELVGSTDRVRFVAQIDRATNYTSADGNWTSARRYLVEQDDDTRSIGSTVLEDLGEVDSADPQTVIDFVEWASSEFPAEHYALVMWDHGWGWAFTEDDGGVLTKGISSDDASHSEISIAEGEFDTVLEGATAALGQRLDLVGMDACLMGSWEVAYVSSLYADVYVASQYYEDTDGWPYDTIAQGVTDDPDISAQELGVLIAERFNESGDSTQSAIDLGKMSDLTEVLDGVANAIMAADDPKTILAEASRASQAFESNNAPDRDLGDFLGNLIDGSGDRSVADAATEALSVYDEAVLASYVNGSSMRDATGLSIYVPYRNYSRSYNDGTWSADTLWDDMLQAALGGPSR